MNAVVSDARIRFGIQDDTGRGLAGINKRISAWGKHLEGVATPMKTVEKSIDAIGRSVGLDKWTKAFGGVGGVGRMTDVATGISATATEVLGLSAAMAMGLGVFGAVGVATAGLGMIAANTGRKWDDAAASQARFAQGLGMSINDVNALGAAMERMGVKGDASASALEGISNAALAYENGDPAMNSVFQTWGLHLQRTKDGLIDIKQLVYDLADLTKKLRPQDQAKLAGIFGFQSAITSMRGGSQEIKKREGESIHLTDKETAQALADQEKWIKEDQITRRWGSHIDRWLAHVTTWIPDAVIALGDHKDKAPSPRPGAARTINVPQSEFEAYVARIEQQESGRHQNWRNGQPKISSASAIGAMQLTPETAAKAAAEAGVAFDPNRLLHDQGYNELLGRAWMRHLLAKYQGDEVLASAAYNAGEAVTDDWINGTNRSGKNRSGRHLGNPRKGEITDFAFAEMIPFAETRNYVEATARNLEVVVRFENAPAGTTATAKAPGSDVKVKVMGAMPHSG